jgi:hypothetical protein
MATRKKFVQGESEGYGDRRNTMDRRQHDRRRPTKLRGRRGSYPGEGRAGRKKKS